LTQGTFSYYHLYPALVFNILFTTLLLAQALTHQKPYLAAGSFIFLIFALSLGTFYFLNNSKANDAAFRVVQSFTKLVNQEADHQNIYGFTMTMLPVRPLIDYTTATDVSRFGLLYMLPAFVFNQGSPAQKKAFEQMIVEDITKGNPKFIFLRSKNPQDDRIIDLEALQYMLTHNRAFHALWQHYTFYRQLGTILIYKRRDANVSSRD
jgi:hypothetical protein